jgi:hypothetical protein
MKAPSCTHHKALRVSPVTPVAGVTYVTLSIPSDCNISSCMDVWKIKPGKADATQKVCFRHTNF